MSELFLNGKIELRGGDCLAVLPTLSENSIDACVTDPPYHLVSIVKRFGADNAAPAKSNGATGVYARASSGFMSKRWDGGDIAFRVETWEQVYRVLKPGAHLVAFGGTRTYHRLACAIEDAGFEMRDCIQWLYASGFPKSHDVSKGIDKAAGVERDVLITAPVTAAAREWSGWGTALKPACELIVLARKPLSEKTVAANVLRWGTGALNIDGCRIPGESNPSIKRRETASKTGNCPGRPGEYGRTITNRITAEAYLRERPGEALGRWPANVCHDGSDEVLAPFPEQEPSSGHQRNNSTFDSVAKGHEYQNTSGHADSGGSAARFFFNTRDWEASRIFYCAKADGDSRLGSSHPTVKPVSLIQWLVRLITPPNGLVLDLFAGTGTTGEAAFREGMRAVLIEREAEYQDDIRRRMKLVLGGPDERRFAAEKEKQKKTSIDAGPLFSFLKGSE